VTGDQTAALSRGIRGGSWNNNANNLSASNRNNNDPSNENNNIGFRLASP
jgi:formylglycine-generating enzyme required for sulfatase activity